MEQTNLVVTPDGKTWDEVTRDTSYIGNVVLHAGTDTNITSTAILIQDEWRGNGEGVQEPFGNKDFAIAYDRQICLKTGRYAIHINSIDHTSGGSPGTACQIYINGVQIISGNVGSAGRSGTSANIEVILNRGDYVQTAGGWYGSTIYSGYWIERI
jgi:hypothetical protein